MPIRKKSPRLVVLIPCYNEEISIRGVVQDFHYFLPSAQIYVYDNNSTDGTFEAAKQAGANVRREPLKGKGNVIRRMFSDIDADIYVLVDGDSTYDAEAAKYMVNELIVDQLDMVVAKRCGSEFSAYRAGHRAGNKVLSGLVGIVFGNRVTDMLSGYRVFSRRFVKTFPALSCGFEIETEMTVHALDLMMPISEYPALYRGRQSGSTSKLRTYSDGLRILSAITRLVKEERPLKFFSITGFVLFCIGLALSFPIFETYFRTGLVPRLPTAVLSVGLVLMSALSFVCGLILESVAKGRREIKRLIYLKEDTVLFESINFNSVDILHDC